MCHFAVVTESLRQSGLEVNCILCKFQTISLTNHQKHLSVKHKYMDSYMKKVNKDEEKGKKFESHEKIRRRVTRVNRVDYNILKNNKRNPSLAEIEGETYDLFTESKSYNTMEHD